MPNPTLSDVHVNRPLTNISVAYLQSAELFVASKVFPPVPVEFKSDTYYRYERANRPTMAIRAPGTESAGGNYKLAPGGPYNCEPRALHHDIDDKIRANTGAPINADSDAVRYLVNQALITREVLFADAFFKTALWGSEKAGHASTANSTQVVFWNLAASTPIEDIRAASTAVQVTSGGFRPNTLLLGRPVYDALCDHPDIIERIKFGQTPGAPAQANKETLAKLFELDRVLVMEAVYDTSPESLAGTQTNAFIGGKHAMLCYSAPNPGLLIPTAGYTFVWTGLLGSIEGQRIKSFRMEHLSSDRIEIEAAYDQKLVGSDLGYFFKDVVQ